MFSWRSTPQPAPALLSLHDTLVRNTTEYLSQLPARIKKTADDIYPTIKEAVLNYSRNNANTLFILSTVDESSRVNLRHLTYEERDKVLELVKERFVADGVECHVDGTCIRIIWSVSNQTTHV